MNRALVFIILSALLGALTGCDAVKEANARADQANDMNKLRQVLMALQGHAMDDDDSKFPESLDVLVKEGLPVELLQTGDGQGGTVLLTYTTGLTSLDHPETILVHGPALPDGKRLCGQIDGAAWVRDEATFQTQLKKHQKGAAEE